MAPSDPYIQEYSEGVREIETSVNAIIARAKQTSSNVFMTFMELDDPYYDIAHPAVMATIKKMPMPDLISQFVMVGQEHRRPGYGIMDSIQCETSRMVMALCMNPILEAVEQSMGFPISSSKCVALHAFVEKMVLVAATEEYMREHLQKVGDGLKAIGLEKIDADRCRYFALTFNNKQMSVQHDLNFKLAGQEIRGVQIKESWKFLGKKFEVK